MARINTSAIEGYAAMSAEDKVKALESLSIPDEIDLTAYVRKSQFDKTASELADAKKKLSEKLSEDEKAKEAEDEARNKMLQELEELRKENKLAKAKSQYLALGYEASLAEDTAKAFVDGDEEKIFANQQKHIEAVKKAAEAEALKKTPDPKGGNGGDTMTLSKFRKMSLAERAEFAAQHSGEYEKLYSQT